MQTSTGTAGYNKFKASTGTSKQKQKSQTTINTRIICRHNYLSTNHNHFRRFVQTSNLVEANIFRSSLPSKIFFLLSRSSRTTPTPTHRTLARQHFTRNVSKPVYHYWLNQFYLSILLHLRVRVTAPLGLATLWKRTNFSSTWCTRPFSETAGHFFEPSTSTHFPACFFLNPFHFKNNLNSAEPTVSSSLTQTRKLA